MKTTCFVMMQNESPILGPFLDQIDALFDQCVILDHQSADNSLSLVQKRDPSRYQIYFLKSSGYPQSEIATWFAHTLLLQGKTDFLFFLDCDEFLPFADRRELDDFLLKRTSSDIITLHWLNIYPENFEGGDIFSNKFYHGAPSAYLKKVILNKNIIRKSDKFILSQGYHSVIAPDAPNLDIVDVKDLFLIHIPIQSLVKFSFKVAGGNNRIIHDEDKKRQRLGAHWISMAQQLAVNGFDRAYMENIVLHYSEPDNESPMIRRKLNFSFPYIKSPYTETSAYVSSQIASLVHYDMQLDQLSYSRFFSVSDSSGNVVFTDQTFPPEYLLPSAQNTKEAPLPGILSDNAPELSQMIEALFDLPLMTPGISKNGFIHFLLVLLKMQKPRSYVLLSNGFGPSLSTVCAAIAEYGMETKVYCVNTAQKDDFDAGPAADIRDYNSIPFSETFLAERLDMTLPEALEHFKYGSVDLLHFEDLCEYRNNKDIVTKWFNTLSPQGIMIFQDIYPSSGMQDYWKELKKSFYTLELSHFSGLGIVFLDPGDPRIAPLLSLANDPKAFAIYNEFVYSIAKAYGRYENRIASKQADIKQLKDIIKKYQSEIALRLTDVIELKSGMDALKSTVSWKITAPLRASKELASRIKSSPSGIVIKRAPGPESGFLSSGGSVPEAIFIDTGCGNTGDYLIGCGCKQFLKDMGIEFTEPDARLVQAALHGDHAALQSNLEGFRGSIFFNGGGNIGIYRENETVRANIIRHAVHAKGILVFPQSCFAPEDSLLAPNVTVWARESQSFALLKKAGVNTALVPDTAFYMEESFPKRPEGSGCFFIRRAEGHCQERLDISFPIDCPSADLTYNTPVDDIITTLSPYRTVISDRLHGAIMSILIRKRTALLPVSYHKNQSFYDTWFKDDPGIGFVQSKEDLNRFFTENELPGISPKKLFLDYAIPSFTKFLNK